MRFYLGTHMPNWLRTSDVPLFVSVRRLRRIRTWRPASCRWAMDSGGFTELSMHGRWTVEPSRYADEIDRAASEIGGLDWAAPQDWMCEPQILARTGLTVAEHQARSVASVVALRGMVGSARVIPVIQGWKIDDYHRCVDLYASAGIDLTSEPVVGVGTVCRRQSTVEGRQIIESIAARGISIHGFGVKVAGLREYGDTMTSSDSMAWSFGARRRPPLPGCQHRNCANCMRYAMEWRSRVVAVADGPSQLRLFGGCA